MKRRPHKKGFVLTAVMMLVLIAALIGSAFLFSARHSFKVLDQWRKFDECLLSAQSGLEEAKYALDQAFRLNYLTNKSWNAMNTLVSFNPSGNYVWTNQFASQPYAITVAVAVAASSVSRSTNNYTAEVLVTNVATVTYGGVTRRVREVVRYVYTDPVGAGGSVFDNAYYVDHQASFNGVNGDFNGEVRAAGNIDFQNCNSLILNGDVLAGGSVLNYSAGSYTWFDSQIAKYLDNLRARPFLWTYRNTNNASEYWPQGYSGATARYDNQPIPEMPYIGPLSEYEAYAIASTGTLTRGTFGTSTVNAVWGDSAGETSGLGITNGADIGCLVLTNGTTINGVVVARGDVYIKGTIRGQGTIYAGRNIYVIGNLTYSNPPSWTKPTHTPSNTASINQTRDFLGLCAKGNLILGNDAKSFLETTAKTPITHSHATDVTDLALGYVSYYENGVPMFNGDYTGTDGQFHDKVRTDGTQRAYYDPILGDAAFNSLGVAADIGKIDGVVYANHMIAGTSANNMEINGSFVCRDEVLKRTGNIYLNWDIRLGSRSYDSIGFGSKLPHMLPRQPNMYRTVVWTELVAP